MSESLVSSVIGRFKETIHRKYLKSSGGNNEEKMDATPRPIQLLRNIGGGAGQSGGGAEEEDLVDKSLAGIAKFKSSIEKQKLEQENKFLDKLRQKNKDKLSKMSGDIMGTISKKADDAKKDLTEKSADVTGALSGILNKSEDTKDKKDDTRDTLQSPEEPIVEDEVKSDADATEDAIIDSGDKSGEDSEIDEQEPSEQQPILTDNNIEVSFENPTSSTDDINTPEPTKEENNKVEVSTVPVVTTTTSVPAVTPAAVPITSDVTISPPSEPQITVKEETPKKTERQPYIPIIPVNPMKKDIGIRQSSPMVVGKVPELIPKKGFQSMDTATYKDPNQVPQMSITPSLPTPQATVPDEKPGEDNQLVFRASLAAILCQLAYSIYYLAK